MKIGIIGHFGGNEKFCDGQTVKTLNLLSLLKRKQEFDFFYVDTYLKKENKIKLILKTIQCLLECKDIFILVSENGIKVYFPFLYYANKIFKRKIYHYIIGSEILTLAKKNKRLIKYLNSITINWFEYDKGTRELKKLGLSNVETLSNFKNLTPITKAVKYVSKNNIFEMCTFSRVMEEKGITEAIESVIKYNSLHTENKIKLDIYGPIDETYKNKFKNLLKKYELDIEYKGIADSNKSIDILKNYFVLLFPTKWLGEGFPGTIIDAYASGIPIIASDWNANKEIIVDNKEGIIYPNENVKNLYEAIEWAILHKEEINEMRVNSRLKYEEYKPENILKIILNKLEEKSGTK